MPDSKRINYSRGIKNICKLTHPSLSVTTRAVRLISSLLNELNEDFVIECQKKFKSKSKDAVMLIAVAESTAKIYFTGDLKYCAVAEGNKALLKYNNNVLLYKPRTQAWITSTKATAKAKRTIGSEFSKGVINLAKVPFPGISFGADTKSLVCNMLGALAKKISDSAKASAQESGSMTHYDIKTAVEGLFPEEMKKHALAEGSKMILFLESGMISFEPVRKRIKRSVKSMTKRAKTRSQRDASKSASAKQKHISKIEIKKKNIYNRGIRHICQLTHPTLSISARGVRLLSNFLNLLNDDLVAECKTKFKSKSKDAVMGIAVASSSVHKTFSGNLKMCAIAEGNKTLLKYNNKILAYKPKTQASLSSAKAKAKAKRTVGSEFTKGVLNMSKVVFPEANLHATAKNLVCHLLGTLLKKISELIKSLVQTAGNVSTTEIKLVVENYFPGQLKKHALAEGSKLVSFLETGLTPFEPTRKRLKKTVKTVTKKTKVASKRAYRISTGTGKSQTSKSLQKKRTIVPFI